MAAFSPTQGRYLSFIQEYLRRYGRPPAESEIAAAMCVAPPSVNQMVKTLEKKGLILRHPGQPRSIELLVADEDIPPWKHRSAATTATAARTRPSRAAAPPADLYVLFVYLVRGPIADKFAGKEISRVIEIRGDQTLEDLHQAIFKAYDRWDEHLYEFQLGKRPFDRAGPNYSAGESKPGRNPRTTKLDVLKLKPHRAFGYWFDFGDGWYHQVQVEKIEQAIPTVTYPRVVKRHGKSPPQYSDE